MNAYLNRLINALSLLSFMFMISTGFLLKWALPHGSGRVSAPGTGQYRKAAHTILGLDRRGWGEIHLYISFGFVLLLCIHLFLHRKWIVATAWGTRANPQPPLRRMITLGMIAFVVIVLGFPWLLRR